ncbi:MAG: hypothetical protein ACOC97_03640 [Myxococcota bacterium]
MRAARWAPLGIGLVAVFCWASRAGAGDGDQKERAGVDGGVPDAAAAVQDGAVPQVLPFDVPWTDREPRLERHGNGLWLTTAALGRPDPRARRLTVMRDSARERAERRARDRLHGWVDDALARRWAPPRAATRAHGTVRAHAHVLGVRPLVEGAAVVLLGVPVAVLRRAAPLDGTPWMP